MVRVETVVFGTSHFAVKDCQFCGRLLPFFHPCDAGSFFLSSFPPKNLERGMSAAYIHFDKSHSPVALDLVIMRAYSFHFSSFTSIGLRDRFVRKAEIRQAVAVRFADEKICSLHYALPLFEAFD